MELKISDEIHVVHAERTGHFLVVQSYNSPPKAIYNLQPHFKVMTLQHPHGHSPL